MKFYRAIVTQNGKILTFVVGLGRIHCPLLTCTSILRCSGHNVWEMLEFPGHEHNPSWVIKCSSTPEGNASPSATSATMVFPKTRNIVLSTHPTMSPTFFSSTSTSTWRDVGKALQF